MSSINTNDEDSYGFWEYNMTSYVKPDAYKNADGVFTLHDRFIHYDSDGVFTLHDRFIHYDSDGDDAIKNDNNNNDNGVIKMPADSDS